MDGAGPVQPDWATDWAAVRPKIVQYLTTNPGDQTFFALDTQTGQPRGDAPVLYTFGGNDPPSPPAAYNQAFYLPYRPRHGIQTDGNSGHVTSRYDAELGRMDPASLDITGLTSADQFGYQFRMTSDEQGIVSVAGNLLLVDSWERLGGVRLSDGALVGIAQVAHDFPECYGQCEANDALMPFYGSYPFPGPRVGEGFARAGAVAASGRIFWRVLESGLAAIGPATSAGVQASITEPRQAPQPAGTPVPQAPAEPRSITTQALSDYVWAEPQRPITAPVDLRQRLEQEVERIVATNQHLLPFYIERGFHGSGSWPPDTTNPPEPATVADSQAFWFDPGELIGTLAIAYPYLSPDLQAQTRAYLQVEMARYSPLDGLTYDPRPWLTDGRAREPYPVTGRENLNVWPPPGVPIQTLYALWAYARYTGDWDYLSARWSAIQALFDAKKTAIDSYAEIAGAIGYARIAKQLGHTAAADEA